MPLNVHAQPSLKARGVRPRHPDGCHPLSLMCSCCTIVCVSLLPGVPGRAGMLAIHNSKAKVVAYGADRIDNWTIFFHGGYVLKGSPGEYDICDEWSEQPAPAAAAAP